MKTIKQVKEYMQAHNWYWAWKANTEHTGKVINDEFWQRLNGRGLINYSFTWSETPQRRSFWSEIDQEFSNWWWNDAD